VLETKTHYIESRWTGISYIQEGDNWIGHSLRRSRLLQPVVEGIVRGAGEKDRSDWKTRKNT
jgi:hypothetical protein